MSKEKIVSPALIVISCSNFSTLIMLYCMHYYTKAVQLRSGMWEKGEGRRERGRKEGWEGEGEEEGGEGGRDRGNGRREREGSIDSKPRKLSLITLTGGLT